MKKSIIRLIHEQKTDWLEFCYVIGLKNTLQQIAVGAAIAIMLLLICGVGEWVHDLIFG